jgi:hypothetical protein
MIARTLVQLVSLALTVLVVGCATRATTIDAQWVSPSVASRGQVQDVLVVAALRDATQRRMLEDRLVEAFAAAGVRASASYKFLAEGAPVSETQLRKAVADAAASYVLMGSISGVTTDVRVTQGMVMGPSWGPGWGPGMGRPTVMGPGWGGMTAHYGASWGHSITSEVRTTQNVHGDTRLFETRSSEVVWSAATTTSRGWDSVPSMIGQFANLIVDALRKDSVI